MNTSAPPRIHIDVSGNVQAVGFRPYCYRLAQQHRLTGWVLNHGLGVSIEIQGEQCKNFLTQLGKQLPAGAVIDRINHYPVASINNDSEFKILTRQQTSIATEIAPDSAICQACLNELFDPISRYYRYPFISCSQCGPRYSVITSLPYDRDHSSMGDFPPCPTCNDAYADPNNRRFHCQSIACPQCGPQLSTPDISVITNAIRTGRIIALKSSSGFHLICDAHNDQAIATLRQRKQRPSKAFAIMCSNLASAQAYADIDPASEVLLCSTQRPIVLVQKKTTTTLTANISPDVNSYGIMLPNTALQYLLFNELAGRPQGTAWLSQTHNIALVMTSANLRAEPVIADNDQAQQQLSSIADLIVDHNLNIVTRCDDSVVQTINHHTMFIRRSRAYTPQAIQLPHAIPSILALGGHLKNTICLSRGDKAYVSQHLGDLDSRATLMYFEETLAHMQKLLAIEPVAIAHDLHPDFHSSQFAQCLKENLGLPTLAIQHHHAHLAAVAAEHHIKQPAIGLALDGYGIGDDQGAWGGELILLDQTNYQRLGHLAPLKQLGGDRSAKEPWRMAAAFLATNNRGKEIAQRFPHPQAAAFADLLSRSLQTATTTSCGRLFDIAASLLGVCHINQYEAQAAMRLENLVTQPTKLNDGWFIKNNQLDFTVLLHHLSNLNDPHQGANLFHGTLIEGLSTWISQHANQQQIKIVLLSGGCFLNRTLSSGLLHALQQQGLQPHLPQQLPANDGGLSLGQAWIAGHRLLKN